mgnify:CR=1 FL=1
MHFETNFLLINYYYCCHGPSPHSANTNDHLLLAYQSQLNEELKGFFLRGNQVTKFWEQTRVTDQEYNILVKTCYLHLKTFYSQFV